MAAGSRDFERAFGAFLALDIDKVRQIGGRCAHGRLRARHDLRAAEMVGKRDQAAGGQDIDAGACPGRFRATLCRADQPLSDCVGADGCRKRTGDGCKRSIEVQLADHHIIGQHIPGYGTERCHQSDGDREVEMAAFLGQVRRGEIDRDLLGRHGEAGGVQGCLHPLAAFGHCLVRQPDDMHAELARADHDLHIDRNAFNALKCYRSDTRDHSDPPTCAS